MPNKKRLSAAAARELSTLTIAQFAEKFNLSVKEVKAERRKRSITAPAKGIRKPLEEKHVKLLGTMSDVRVAEICGRPPSSISSIRNKLGIAPFGKKRSELEHRWTKTQLNWLGKKTDAEIAKRIGVDNKTVSWKRWKLGIPSVNRGRQARKWKTSEICLLGKMPDVELGERLGINRKAVLLKRLELGIVSFMAVRTSGWSPQDIMRLGVWTDKRIAQSVGCPVSVVKEKRGLLKLPPGKSAGKIR